MRERVDRNKSSDQTGRESAEIDSRLVRVKSGSDVYSQGEAAECLYYLEAGRAQLSVLSSTGRIAIVQLLSPGEYLGEDALTPAKVRATTATALDDCRLLRIEPQAALAADGTNGCSARVLVDAAQRLSRLNEQLAVTLTSVAEQRLGRLLINLADSESEDPAPLVIDVTHETLAAMVGTTRSRISLFLRTFRELGILEKGRTIRIYRDRMQSYLKSPK